MPMTPSPLMDNFPILTFSIGSEMYALPIEDVVEVAAMVELTPIREALPEFLGVVDRHGILVPIVDLRLVFKHEAAPVTPATLFIVTRRENKYLGLVVDDVHQVEYITEAEQREVSITGKHIRGIINHKSHLIQIISLTSLWTTFQTNEMAEDKG